MRAIADRAFFDAAVR